MTLRSPLAMVARLADGGPVNPYAGYRSSATPDRAAWDYGGYLASDVGLRDYGVAEPTWFQQETENGPIDGRFVASPEGWASYVHDDQNGIRWAVDNQGYIIPGSNVSTRSNQDFNRLVLATIGGMAGVGLAGAGSGAAAGAAEGAGVGSAAGSGAGAGVGAGTASSGASAAIQQAAAAAARNALINGTLAEVSGGGFADGARAGALSGLAAPIGSAATGAASSAGFGATTSAALGGAAQGTAGTVLSSATRNSDIEFEDLLRGAASGAAGASMNDALGGGVAGAFGGRTAAGLVGGRDLEDALLAAARGTLTNPNSYRSSGAPPTSSGGPTMGDDLPETDMWTYDAGSDGLPEMDDWDYGGGAAEDDPGIWDWGSREGGNYPDPESTSGSPWNSSYPELWEQIVGAGGGALGSIGNWLGSLWQGNPQSRNQANWLLGLLGAYQAYRTNSGGGSGGGGPRLSPGQLQGMLPGGNANATWNEAQRAASQRLFSAPLTQLSQPGGPTAVQRYGVDPMAPKYADGGEVLPARRPTDPVPGTRGPMRRPTGGSPAEEAALRAVVQRGATPRNVQAPPRPGPGAPRVTVERLRRAETYAAGGEVMDAGPLSMMGAAMHEGPGYVMSGEGGGQDDQVDAALSPGEYVFDADVVSALGDGSNEEGARRLDEMRVNIREHKRSAPADSIPPKARAPEAYLPR